MAQVAGRRPCALRIPATLALCAVILVVAQNPARGESLEASQARASELGIELVDPHYKPQGMDEDGKGVEKAVATPWYAVQRHDDTVYFLYQSPPAIERYDLSTQAWLDTVSLPGTPDAFGVDASHYYVSFGTSLDRFDHDGGNETHCDDSTQTISDMVLGPDHVVYRYDYHLVSIAKNDLLQKDDYEDYYEVTRLGHANSESVIFTYSSGSPRDLNLFTYDAGGVFTSLFELPYHGDYPLTWPYHMFPDDGRIVTSDGIVFDTATLLYDNGFGGSFDDLDFYGDLPILRRSGTYVGLTGSFDIFGTHTPANTILKHYVLDDDVFGFYSGTSTVDVEITPIASFAFEPAVPVDPDGLVYSPSETVLSDDGVVYLLSATNQTVFAWDMYTRDYIDGIGLYGSPDHMAYSSDTESLYLGYTDGRITRIELEGTRQEEFLANLPQSCMELATVGEFILAVDPSGAWDSHFTFSHCGTLVDQEDWNYESRTFAWSPVNRKVYHFRDGTSPNDILWEEINEDGTIGTQTDSPFHGGLTITDPISVSPDGGRVLLGSGDVFDGTTLARLVSLSNTVESAAWIEDTLYTLKGSVTDTEVQKWNSSYTVTASVTLTGTPLALFSAPEGLLVIHKQSGFPVFTSLDENLTTLSSITVVADPAPVSGALSTTTKQVEESLITGTYTASGGAGTGVARVSLYARRAWQPWKNAGEVTGDTWAYTAVDGTGIYFFQTVAMDSYGNMEELPLCQTGRGDCAVVYNAVRNGQVALPIHSNAGGKFHFPMTNNASLRIEFGAVSSAGTVTVERFEGNGMPTGFGNDAAFMNQWWRISGGDGLAFDTVRLEFDYDETLLGEIAEEGVDGAWRDAQGSVSTYGVTVDTDANTIAVEGVTGFSDWFFGDSSALPVELDHFGVE